MKFFKTLKSVFAKSVTYVKSSVTYVKSLFTKKTAVGVGLMAVTGLAVASTDGAEFQSTYTMIKGWTTGYLGRAIAIASVLMGAGIGMAKSTIMPAAMGIAFALALTVGPSVVDGMMTAII
ncbi:TraA family conjugative transfer protein [Hydromonas duriensis]|uniref:Conjugal transfer pilus assembly protein TraA n=1 Tax=Hydromonas duriensis TaxID=1527608 RepID=A0A4R6Y4X1_9BURK|nr:TraA family conjugative transfer protein [Hydromonas duriensis]TDR30279.1 hypothetical protein DFR44_1233 [Hydromonas duriensis]